MAYIGVSPSNGVRQKHTYTATASQTSFSGAGAEGISLSYLDSNYVDVYQNGVKLSEADYTSTTGTTVVLATGATVSDMIEIIVYDVFSVADTVSKADGGTFDGNVTMAGTLAVTGNETVGGTLGVTGILTANAGIKVDDITIDGTEIDLSGSGDFTVDVGGDIIFDADSRDIKLQDGTTDWGLLQRDTSTTTSSFVIKAMKNDSDLKLKGVDNNSEITALTLDMSANGKAFFSDSVALSDGKAFIAGGDADLQIYHTNGGANHIYGQTAHHIDFSTSDTFRMRLKDDGALLVAQTANNTNVVGFGVHADGFAFHTRSAAQVLAINRLSDDGALISLRQGNNEEGTISSSGSTFL